MPGQPNSAIADAILFDGEKFHQVNAFAAGISSARIVRLPHANHFVFLSNEADCAP
jgi:hypothetical protein